MDEKKNLKKIFLGLFLIFLSSFFSQGQVCAASELTPVILIPGTSRIKLVDSRGKVVWGNLRNFFEWKDQDRLAIPIDFPDPQLNRDSLSPGPVMKEVALIPYVIEFKTYRNFLKKMKKAGYQLGDMKSPREGDNFFIFEYDWRRSHVENAVLLSGRIKALKAFYRNQNIKFDVVAHCAGALIARYYAFYGGKDVLGSETFNPDYSGAKNIRNLIYVAPLRRGTIYALKILHQGFHPIALPFFLKYSPAEAFSAPAFFEILPYGEAPVFLDEQGSPLEMDLYAPETWIQFGISVFHPKELEKLKRQIQKKYPRGWEEKYGEEYHKRLEYLKTVLFRSKRFRAAMDERVFAMPKEVKEYQINFYGKKTVKQAEYRPGKKEMIFGKSPTYAFRTDDGDGMVSVPSMVSRSEKGKPEESWIKDGHTGISNNRAGHEKIIHILTHSQR